jgi:Zn-dependent peptidase ImmA (M78 family)
LFLFFYTNPEDTLAYHILLPELPFDAKLSQDVGDERTLNRLSSLFKISRQSVEVMVLELDGDTARKTWSDLWACNY